MMKFEVLVSRLDVVRRFANDVQARCPAHEDKHASLHVTLKDGKILIRCFAGCTVEDVVAARGMSMADLFEDDTRHVSIPDTPYGQNGAIVATYVYNDEDGEPLFHVCRFDLGKGEKRFTQGRYLGDGRYASNMDGASRVLYHLPAVLDAARHGRRILYVEGEKDVESLAALGIMATTHAGGSANWKEHYKESLEGAEVVILPDNDPAGKKMASQILKDVKGSRIVELPNLPEKGDVSDWLAAGGTKENLLKILGPELSDLAPVVWEEFQAEKETATFYCGDILVEESVNMLVADGGVGKTTLVVQLCLSLASGTPFLGIECPKPIKVLLLEAEGARSMFRVRSEKARAALKIPAGALKDRWYIQSKWMNDFAAGGMMVEDHIRRSGAQVVVMDTLGYFLAGGKENSADDWKEKIMSPLNRFARMYGCAFILLHHEGKPSEFRASHQKGRGTSAMFDDSATWMSLDHLHLTKEELASLTSSEKEASKYEKILTWGRSKVGRLHDPITLHLDIENAVFSIPATTIREQVDQNYQDGKVKRPTSPPKGGSF